MIRSFTILVIVALVVGCGEKYPRRPVVQAEGKVLYKGKPAIGAQVLLVPEGDDSPDAVKPRGRVGPDGVYRLTTYPAPDGKPDGAPPGKYLVSLRWTSRPAIAADPDEPDPAGPPGGPRRDFLRDKYSNPKTSGLTVQVEPNKPIAPIELK